LAAAGCTAAGLGFEVVVGVGLELATGCGLEVAEGVDAGAAGLGWAAAGACGIDTADDPELALGVTAVEDVVEVVSREMFRAKPEPETTPALTWAEQEPIAARAVSQAVTGPKSTAANTSASTIHRPGRISKFLGHRPGVDSPAQPARLACPQAPLRSRELRANHSNLDRP